MNTGYTYHCNVNVTEETADFLQNDVIRILLLNLKKVAFVHRSRQTQKVFVKPFTQNNFQCLKNSTS